MVTEYTVLVVDDEPAYCEVMRELLELISLNVVIANNVSDALSLLEGLIPDIILSDLMMPEISGFTFLRQLRSNSLWCQIPVIFVSAKATLVDHEAAQKDEVNGFLLKPFRMQELMETIGPYLPVD